MKKPATLVELIAAGGKLPITETIRRDIPKLGRNKECFCGSGVKYKKCCLLLEQAITQLGREQDTEEEMGVGNEE